mmetsp:Transcript_29784/g.68593  ORF Transcript_29784/g.68593 Transcript_29784/m.68593 type:complete len:387 (+) Transcript_29784:79-1239(+)
MSVIKAAGPIDSGAVVHMGMVSGKVQLEELQRQACLTTRTLSQEEKEAIQRRREACRDKRRAALNKADELVSARGSGLQARIAVRRKVMEEAGEGKAAAEHSGGQSTDAAEPDTDQEADGQHETTRRRLVPAPKRQRRKRITFSAITSALQEVSSTETASRIEAARALAAEIFASGKPADPADGEARGAKRSSTGVRRRSSTGHRDSISSNVGAESMLRRAAKAAAGNVDDDSSDEEVMRPPPLCRSDAGCQAGGGAYPEGSENVEPLNESMTSVVSSGCENPSSLRRRRLALVGASPVCSSALNTSQASIASMFSEFSGDEQSEQGKQKLPPPPMRIPRRRLSKLASGMLSSRRPLAQLQSRSPSFADLLSADADMLTPLEAGLS